MFMTQNNFYLSYNTNTHSNFKHEVKIFISNQYNLSLANSDYVQTVAQAFVYLNIFKKRKNPFTFPVLSDFRKPNWLSQIKPSSISHPGAL